MEEDMMVNGNKITCTEEEPILGKMAESILENILMIKNTGMENIHGLMVVNTSGNGKMENKTEKEDICYQMVLKE